jgi:D-alanine-D-alanine ligase
MREAWRSMKIAFTHNLQITNSEEEAEFDRPETVEAIAKALRSLGHEVEPIDVAGSASRLVARLEALSPDLVFNTAEGTRGRFREAFYPALFDLLGLPFTGSDAYACALTLDKQLTKVIVAQAGVPTPKWHFVAKDGPIPSVESMGLEFPIIVKPNFEGSSMGISADSVVEDEASLTSQLEKILNHFSEGAILEEFVDGSDLTVPFLEKARPDSGGILEPAQYLFDLKNTDRRYNIYDYELKQTHFDSVHIKVPAEITTDVHRLAMEYSLRAIKALNIRDAARVDFRLTPDGKLYFIEINALPSFEPGASIYASAALAGYDTLEKVMGAVVESACDRFSINIPSRRRRGRKTAVKVGFTFNLRRVDNAIESNSAVDNEVEFDSPETTSAIREAIASYGHEVIDLEATRELPSILPNAGVDVVFNIAEGIEGRTRESQVPALLELLGIPYTGSDPTTLSISHDKALAKRLAIQAGIKTPPFILMTGGKERLPKSFTFPCIIKPVAEGSSKGIISKSVVENEAELREVVQETIAKYRQSVIAESFLPGREFTVALLGERRPRALPPLEVIFPENKYKYAIYSFEGKFFNKDIRFDVPAKVDGKLRRELERVARSVFTVLGCRDLARVDMRLDADGQIHFVECNPIPGLAPGFSDFCVIAEAAGISFRTLVGEILAPALRRMRERQKERVLGIGR